MKNGKCTVIAALACLALLVLLTLMAASLSYAAETLTLEQAIGYDTGLHEE
jgi:hypothetical protein